MMRTRISFKEGISIDKLLETIAEGINARGYNVRGSWRHIVFYIEFVNTDILVGLVPGDDYQGWEIGDSSPLPHPVPHEVFVERLKYSSRNYIFDVYEGEIDSKIFRKVQRKFPGMKYSTKRYKENESKTETN